MNTVREIVDTIGRERLAEALGLKNAKSIQPAISEGAFPAAWFTVVEELGRKQGLKIPKEAFKWKKSEPVKSKHHTAA